MIGGFLDALDRGVRRSYPLVITLMLTPLGGLALHIPGMGSIAPPLAMMSLFFWSALAPLLMPLWGALLCGVLHDLISGGPLGLGALGFVITRQAALMAAHMWNVTESFMALWRGFSLTCIAIAALSWLIAAAVTPTADGGSLPPLAPVVVQAALAIILFPLIAVILYRLKRFFGGS